MEMFVPDELELAYTYSTTVSAYPNWVSGSDYNKGERVHDAVSGGGDGQDYKAEAYLNNNTTRPSNSSNKDWSVLGITSSDALSFESDTDLSEYETWTNGQQVYKGKIQVDLSDRNDYICTVYVAGGSNTTRPSVAVLSDDEDLAARWVKIGTANAFRMFDGKSLSKTRAESTLTCTANAHGLCDRIAFFGLDGVKTVDVTVNAGDKIPNPSFTSSLLTGWAGAWTYSSGQLNISANNNARLPTRFIPGRSYQLVATFSGNSGTFYAQAKSPDNAVVIGSVNSAAASGTLTLNFTATSRQHLLVFATVGSTVALTSATCKETSFAQETVSLDLEYPEGGHYKTCCKVAHEPVDSPIYDITFSSEYEPTEIRCGLAIVGKSEALGVSRADVTDATDDYSSIVFDQEYGTGTFVERGYSRRLSVTLQIEDGASGAFVNQRLRSVRATPCFWDLNNDGNDDGLLVHGLAQRPQRSPTGLSNMDVIRLELKGLVE